MANFTAGDVTSIDVTKVEDGKTVVRTLRPTNGVFRSDDSAEIATFRSFGLTERTDAQVKASTKTRKASTKTRGEAGQKGTVKVVDEATGEQDTRGPGAPVVEPGIREV